jgi:hypothetical protein
MSYNLGAMDERWSEQKRRQDIDDLNNEMAGRDVGRIRRFLPDRDPETIAQKKREKDARETALQQLLRDPAYAAAYERACNAIDRAQAALDEALLENAETVERLAQELEAMEGRAARLPDGRAVFRANDGTLRTADGQRLRSEAVLASLIIPTDAPSYEDYAASRDALTDARERGHQLSRVQTEVIDPARNRTHDADNPLSFDELEEIEREMGRAEEALVQADLTTVLDQGSGRELAPSASADLGLDDLPAPLR